VCIVRRLHLDLVFCNKIVFGIVHISSDDLFTFSTVAHTRGHGYKLYKPRCVSSVRRNFFVERIINVWNFLSHTVDFSSLSKFKRSLNRVDFSAFYGMHSHSCFISCVFFNDLWAKCKRQFLCLSCPALVFVLIMCASSCSVDLSK